MPAHAFKSPPHPDSHGVENQAGNADALVIGGFQQSLGVYLYEREVLDRLVEVAAERGRGRLTRDGNRSPSAYCFLFSGPR